jgi:magnesium chelatase subunit D
MPPQVDDERLLGGLDLGLSLAAGRPVLQAGLLAEAAGGVLLLPLAERTDPSLAAKLALALDRPRHGLCLLALDEASTHAEAPEAAPPPALMERLALVATPAPVDLAAALRGDPTDAGALDFDVAAAQARCGRMPYDADTVHALCATAAALGLDSLRAPWQAWRAACAAAAVAGREAVSAEDAELAARLVLAPRARAWPAPPADASADPPTEAPAQSEPPAPPPPETPPPSTEVTGATDPPTDPASDPARAPTPLPDQVLAAAQAAIPAGLLASLAGGSSSGGRSTGRRGAALRAASGGRPLASRRGPLRAGARLDLLATLRAAIPWQALRQRERDQAGLGPAPTRLLLRRDDFHVRRFGRPEERTAVFVVDASGSQAMARLAEAKGAVECLLADCYVRRDRVALIAFRGESAELLLPPTRSLVRAKRSLSGLPGGGGTPLAAGLDAAWQLARQLQARQEGQVVLVFLTDARANIARDGQPGRPQAMADALDAARRLRVAGWPSVLVDSSARPQPAAMALAQTMGARYVPLPQGQSGQVYEAVAGALGGGRGAGPG